MHDLPDRLVETLSNRYQIQRELGQGGMATVYLAEDLKHNRKVAIKVLKPELAAVLGAERFVQEIKTTAALSHPHILPLFDSGRTGGWADGRTDDSSSTAQPPDHPTAEFLYYVMPYVEGETLRDKLSREHQLGIEKAVKITTDVADALDYAHRHGVIHRDIKPENILLHDGRPMVMDFGIALAVSAAAGGRMTETGLSLGTPHYMSPEQATAEKDITGRSDIYSLGAVLYEMLTGDPPHTGSTAQQVIAKIVSGEPQPVTELRKTVPPNVAAAIARALEKVPADRFDSAKSFADALVNPAFATAAAGVAAGATARPLNRPATLTAVLAVTTLFSGGLAIWGWLRPSPAPMVARFDVTPRAGQASGLEASGLALEAMGTSLALSSDGRRIVFVGAAPDGGTQLWVRSLAELEPAPVQGTDGATSAAISFDGETVAFERDGGIFTAPLTGGPTVSIAKGSDPAWGDDGWLYFARDQIIYRVRTGGGQPEAVTTEIDGEQIQPRPLPDGMGLLLTVRRSLPTYSRIAVVGPEGGTPREILDGTTARYAASGHLVYTTADGTMQAARFDLRRREAGPAAPLLANVAVRGSSHTLFALSDNGTLLYQTRAPSREVRTGAGRPFPWTPRGLADSLNREKQLGIYEAIKITTEVADALDYAHRQNVIHRDIKPENILLHDGRPMVADFGIALAVSAAAGGRMTETGLSLGTPHYMSPEQATAEKDLTNRSDIYSLGGR